MSTEDKANIYAPCKQYKRKEPDYSVSEEIAKAIGGNFRIIPTFAKGQYEYVLKRHYSLERNELLSCRWEQYKKNIEQREFAPFQFPDVRDLHFHNCVIRFLPNESIHRFPQYNKKMRAGPGVDFVGQIPIPQELLMKRITKPL
ncbi:hypothetical protein O3G_MSEX011865 [Manduca sexta]|uniref:Uncharacterized protein n=1 Tax=Manduca sexta TaxID=7130 RepID=A0A922CVW9_MANSE|nr:hypothetical protein O3G_MSEX011865 [Manduca sexta]